MIGKLVLTRIEPCFMANKPANGEISRVKKDVSGKLEQPEAHLPKDTFTSSQNVNNKKQKTNVSNQKKYTHEDN